MQVPQVSVLVPTYNRSAFLKLTLESVFQQTFTDFEIVVVDNCSTDNTTQVVAAFDDSRIVYVRNEVNIGAVNNYNKALRLARGKYIYLFSDDDVMLDVNNLQLKIDILDSHPNVGVVHSDYDVINVAGERIGGNAIATTPMWKKIAAAPLLKGAAAYPILYEGTNFVSMTSALLRASVLQDNHLEFNNQLRYFIDWCLWLHLSLFCDFYYIDSISTAHRRHTTNESSLVRAEHYYNEELLAKIGLITLFGHTGKIPQTNVVSIFKSIKNPHSIVNTIARNVERVQGRIRRMVG